jgi:hypothetical protein
MSVKYKFDKSKEYIKAFQNFSNHELFVGFPSESVDRGEQINNAELAYIHENGSPANNIPARPFLLSGVKESYPKVVEIFKESVKNMTTSGKADSNEIVKGLHRAGEISVNSVKARITNQVGFIPLAESTLIARQKKGFKGTSALIVTGKLLNSIKFVVKKKG